MSSTIASQSKFESMQCSQHFGFLLELLRRTHLLNLPPYLLNQVFQRGFEQKSSRIPPDSELESQLLPSS